MKKRSGWNRRSSQPEPVFFTDRDLAKAFPLRLRDAGLRVETYFDHFPGRDTVPDSEWLSFAAARRWVALSHDKHIKNDEAAIRAVMASAGRLFIIRGTGTALEWAELFLDVRRRVSQILAKQPAGFIGVVRRRMVRGGVEVPHVEVWMTLQDWEKKGRRLRRRR